MGLSAGGSFFFEERPHGFAICPTQGLQDPIGVASAFVLVGGPFRLQTPVCLHVFHLLLEPGNPQTATSGFLSQVPCLPHPPPGGTTFQTVVSQKIRQSPVV